jgi:leucyl-tRNA synthetase
MSKSKGNVVDPDDMIKIFGADTVRLFCLFASPPDKDLDWSDQGVEGCSRFLNRCWRLILGIMNTLKSRPDLKKGFTDAQTTGNLTDWAKKLRQVNHITIKKVTIDIEKRLHFNTAISSIMEMVNDLYAMDISRVLVQFSSEESSKKNGCLFAVKEAMRSLILLLAPFVPHIAEEMWEEIGEESSVFDHAWPKFDPQVAQKDEIVVVIQVNGKVRSRLMLSSDSNDEEIKQAALNDPKIKEWIGEKNIKKIILVPNKLVNIVI